ncbi:YppG family protein [Bacillus sp. B1-b2]|uniref:YppG family protein n=1 Tax=Bacillus sp. B1-b2 TaxID=2653201 RepID=UPI001261B005|nr:YppG family protein [Bacillus sp. B1-b2]KAB7672965.1 hypothetical protein F9279_00640 [Bacillus sp. B1-b2]
MYRTSFQSHSPGYNRNSYHPFYTQLANIAEYRQYHPYMQQPQHQQWNGMGMNHQYPYGMSMEQYQGNYEGNYFHPQNAYKGSSQNIFQNPLNNFQQTDQMNSTYNHNYTQQQGYMNPYPKQSFMPKKQGNMKTFMNSFKSQDGSLDFPKMMDTAGMMMNAMNQVTGLVKGVGGIFKV